MTAAVARYATAADHDLLGDYIAFCRDLGVSDRALRDRLRAARRFLAVHPDLTGWMRRPVPARVTDLRRTGAWPLVGWAILTGHITADLELLLVKDFGTLGEAAERLMPVDFADAHAAADRLGWSPTWARSIVREALVLTIAATGRTLRQLTADDLDALGEQIAVCPLITDAARKRHRAQLFGLAQLLFECRVLDAPPIRRYPPAASITQRFTAVLPDTLIRAAMIRYVTAREAVLAASSVDGLANDLIPFGAYLADHHPQVTRLAQLDRGYIEGFLAVNRTRTWRGRVARDQQVSASVAHAAVLALRNFLDDITLWGWADRPTRQLVFAADVPRLPRPLPRALPPDDDTALLAAIDGLDDPFARCGCSCCATPGCAWVSCSTSNSTPSSTTVPPAPGCGSHWASSRQNGPSRSTTPPSPRSTPGPPPAVHNARSHTPRPAAPPTFCSPPRDAGWVPGGSAPGWTAPPLLPGCWSTPATPRGSHRTGCGTPTPPAWPTPGCPSRRSWRCSGTSPPR